MKQEKWAYLDNITGEFRHIYGSKKAVELCSPDYFKTARQKKEGKVVKVIVQLAPTKKRRRK